MTRVVGRYAIRSVVSREMISKPLLISLVVFGLHVIITCLGTGNLWDNPGILGMSVFGLACIWIGNKKGGHRRMIPGIQIYPPSSGFMMRSTGWAFLVSSFILLVVAKITNML